MAAGYFYLGGNVAPRLRGSPAEPIAGPAIAMGLAAAGLGWRTGKLVGGASGGPAGRLGDRVHVLAGEGEEAGAEQAEHEDEDQLLEHAAHAP